jgi:hypothetical protein
MRLRLRIASTFLKFTYLESDRWGPKPKIGGLLQPFHFMYAFSVQIKLNE